MCLEKYNEKFLDYVIKELEQEYNYAKENFADFSKKVFDAHDLRETCVLKPIEICLKFSEFALGKVCKRLLSERLYVII